MKTKQTLTAIYHPQSNDKNERSHAILKEYLRHYSNEQEPWDIVLPKATLSYNTTVNRITKYTPFELQLGYEPNSILEEMDEDETYEQIVQNKKYKHEQILKEAKENITDAQPSISYENLEPILPNSKVLTRNYTSSGLQARWKGPYKVEKILPNQSIIVNKNGKLVTHHRTNVKIFRHRDLIISEDEEDEEG